MNQKIHIKTHKGIIKEIAAFVKEIPMENGTTKRYAQVGIHLYEVVNNDNGIDIWSVVKF